MQNLVSLISLVVAQLCLFLDPGNFRDVLPNMQKWQRPQLCWLCRDWCWFRVSWFEACFRVYDLQLLYADMYKSSVGFSRRRMYPSKESWSGTGTSRSSRNNYGFGISLSNNSFSNKVEDAATSACLEAHPGSFRDQGRDTIVQQPSLLKKLSSAYDEVASISEAENQLLL
ncbi:hypothetical protein L6452_32020 [Arctium lappa]|uniref:Uncharacterized protein n=1 Tax=Arctium lappa TaxID=4217 RepID=A0ACB8Z3H0_ARCLA|nr:hypothetical protein L6452_32020 [Arctium lappa]